MTLTEKQEEFVSGVLRLEPRVAVFDCDGTLWTDDSGQGFFYWSLERGLFPPEVAERARRRYDIYLKGGVEETAMCGEMVTYHAGQAVAEVQAESQRFFAAKVAPNIFPEMLELTHRLATAGCELWAVSSTNEWTVAAGVERFGIPAERVLAACVEVSETGKLTDRIRHVPSGDGKAEAIRRSIHRSVDAAFGNSIHDAAMLRLARHGFAINPNPDLAEIAVNEKWTIYRPR